MHGSCPMLSFLTSETGAETAGWLQREGLAGPILLISSEQHLARADPAAGGRKAVTVVGRHLEEGERNLRA